MTKELIDASSCLGSNDEPYKKITYNPPNYKDLPSASDALDKAIHNFFTACMERNNGK
jgi:hypothetical protein